MSVPAPRLRPSEARSLPPPAVTSSQRGFTLVEMMLAVGVFMIGMAGVVTMQLAARHGRVSSNDLSLATNLATSTLDLLETQDFDGLADATAWYDRQGVQLGSAAGAFFTITTTITTDVDASTGVPGDVKSAVAHVSWSNEGYPHDITLATKITR